MVILYAGLQATAYDTEGFPAALLSTNSRSDHVLISGYPLAFNAIWSLNICGTYNSDPCAIVSTLYFFLSMEKGGLIDLICGLDDGPEQLSYSCFFNVELCDSWHWTYFPSFSESYSEVNAFSRASQNLFALQDSSDRIQQL